MKLHFVTLCHTVKESKVPHAKIVWIHGPTNVAQIFGRLIRDSSSRSQGSAQHGAPSDVLVVAVDLEETEPQPQMPRMVRIDVDLELHD